MKDDIIKQVPFWEPANELLGCNINENSVPYNVNCPFHVDDTPSMRVFPDGLAYCFGCGRMYSSFDCAVLFYGNYKEAIQYFKDNYEIKWTTKEDKEKEVFASKQKIQTMVNNVSRYIKDGRDVYSILREIHREMT